MAMFVLVIDRLLMNGSISAVVRDLDTTVSGVQSAVAIEALVCAAFILIGSRIGDLFGRKRATSSACFCTGLNLCSGVTALLVPRLFVVDDDDRAAGVLQDSARGAAFQPSTQAS
jgi:MFS family permease